MQIVEIDHFLMTRAATFADVHSLRGYDASHRAGAQSINDRDLVAVSGDKQLPAAWREIRVDTLDLNA